MRRTSALILIGNEILSGRTRDDNIQFLALRLGELGIPLVEIRVIPDIRATIINTVTELRARFDEVFTTGGIGPTHDDITSPCVAEAFGVPWEIHAPTFAVLQERFGPENFNTARQRMAKLPKGATPIANPVSIAPGFSIGNVHVLAGVPRIMRAMFEELAPTLQKGAPVFSRTWYTTLLGEGALADGLEAIQERFTDLDIGSYPFHREGGHGVALVAKGQDKQRVNDAAQAIHDLLKEKGGSPVEGEPPV